MNGYVTVKCGILAAILSVTQLIWEIIMKAPEFSELVSVINQLDHHHRSLLAATLTQLSDEPKVFHVGQCMPIYYFQNNKLRARRIRKVN